MVRLHNLLLLKRRARCAVALNGLSAVALTKLDVLSGFERTGIVTDYRVDGGSHASVISRWLRSATRRLEELIGVPIELVSVAPQRSQLARLGTQDCGLATAD